MPPRDPYVPVPTAQPKQVRGEIATEPINIRFDPVRISGAVGDALEKLGSQGYGTLSRATAHVGQAFDSFGKSLEHAGDQLWNRAVGLQQLENETKESNALVEYERYVNEQREKLLLQKGANATSTSLKTFNDDLEAKRQELRAKLPAAVQRRFDPQSISFAGRAGTVAATHMATETRAAAVGAANARIDMAMQRVTNANSIPEAMKAVDEMRQQMHDNITPALGYTPDQEKAEIQKKTQHGFAAMMNRISDEGNPWLAKKMLAENPNLIIDPNVEQQVRRNIQADELRISKGAIADRIQDEKPDAPLEDKLAKGDKMAAEHPNLPELQSEVRQQIRVLHRTRNEEVAEVRKQSWDKIGEGMDGIKVPGGKRPKNEMDLFAQGPEYKEAWGHLTDKQKTDARAIMARMALGDMPRTEATDARVAALEGLHDNNPEVFRDVELRKEPIPLRDQDKLRTMQRDLIKKGHNLEADPKIQAALSRVRWALPKDMTPSHSQYNEFVGVFRQGVKALESDLNYSRPLKEEEELKIARTALEKVGGLWGFFAHPFYKDIATEKIPDALRLEMMKLKPDITDDEMRDDYMRLRMRQELQDYQKKHKAKP